jgi:dTMP kinase
MQVKGKFITIEGIDGCGKSTLSENLADIFRKKNIPVLLTKEPGGSELGKDLRKILNHHNAKLTENDIPVCDKAEYLLFAADRAQHYKEIISPGITTGKIVISDRWADSSVAYQGYGRGLNLDIIKSINNWATNGINPDVTFYIRIDAQTALDRIKKRNLEITTFEKEKLEFWIKVEHGYEKIFANQPHVVFLNGKLTQEELLKSALENLKFT